MLTKFLGFNRESQSGFSFSLELLFFFFLKILSCALLFVSFTFTGLTELSSASKSLKMFLSKYK